ASEGQLFTSSLEGVAYVERFAFELIQALSGERVNTVFTAGGGSKSDVWLQIRSNVLNLPIVKMRHVSGAAGAAILAASRTFFASLSDATRAMTQIEKRIVPDPGLAHIYNKHYHQFLTLLKGKGYISKQKQHA